MVTAQPRSLHRRARRRHRVLHERPEVERLAVQGQRRGLGSGQRGKVVDHPAQANRLRVEGVESLLIGLDEPVAQLLESGLQRGERGAQLVGDVRRHLLSGALGPRDVRRRRVERPRQLAQLARGSCVGGLRPRVAVAGGERLG